MADTPQTMRITVKVEEVVPRVIAEKIAESFLEYLDEQGYDLRIKDPNGPLRHDVRGYDELAAEFCDHWIRVVG